MNNAYILLGVLQSYAPDGEAQATCARFYWNIHKNGTSQKEVVTALAEAISEGLRHNNWPWSE